MTELFINYEEGVESGGEICAGQENDAWPSYEDTFKWFSVKDITLKNTNPYHETFQCEGQVPSHLYVVVVRYYDGNTFGRTCGYGHIEAVLKTKEEAEILEKRIWEDNDFISYRGYNPWHGYFSGLEDVEVHKVMVDKE